MVEIRCTGNIKFGELRGKKCNRKLGELAGDNYHLLIQCSRCKSMNLFVAPEPTKKAEPNEGIAALLSLSDHIFTQDVRSKILANPEAVHHALNSHADKIKSISEDIKSLLSL